jgi:hypothetical protein
MEGLVFLGAFDFSPSFFCNIGVYRKDLVKKILSDTL